MPEVLTTALHELSRSIAAHPSKYFYFVDQNDEIIQVEEKDLDRFFRDYADELKKKKIQKAYIGRVGEEINVIRESHVKPFLKKHPDSTLLEYTEHPIEKPRTVGIIGAVAEKFGAPKPVEAAPPRVSLKETAKELIEIPLYATHIGRGLAFLPGIGIEAVSGLAGVAALPLGLETSERVIAGVREKLHKGLEKVPFIGRPETVVGRTVHGIFSSVSAGVSSLVENYLKSRGVRHEIAETAGEVAGRGVWDAMLIAGGYRTLKQIRDAGKRHVEATKQALKDLEREDPQWRERLRKAREEKEAFRKKLESKFESPEKKAMDELVHKTVEYMNNPELLEATRKWHDQMSEAKRKAERIRYMEEQLKWIDQRLKEKGIDVEKAREEYRYEKAIEEVERKIQEVKEKKGVKGKKKILEGLERKKETLQDRLRQLREEKVIEEPVTEPVVSGEPVLPETRRILERTRNPLEMALELYRKTRLPWDKVTKVYPEVKTVDEAIIRKLNPKEVADQMVDEGKSLIEVVSWYRVRPKEVEKPVTERSAAGVTEEPRKEKVSFGYISPNTHEIYVKHGDVFKKYDPEKMEIVEGLDKMESIIRYLEYERKFTEKYKQEYPGLADEQAEFLGSQVALDAFDFGEEYSTVKDLSLTLKRYLKEIRGVKDRKIPRVIEGLKQGKTLEELIEEKTEVKPVEVRATKKPTAVTEEVRTVEKPPETVTEEVRITEKPSVAEKARAPKKDKVIYSHTDPATGEVYVIRYGVTEKYDPQMMEIVTGLERMEKDTKYVEYKKKFAQKYKGEYPGLTDSEVEFLASKVALDAINFGESFTTVRNLRIPLVIMLKRRGLRSSEEISRAIRKLKRGKSLEEPVKEPTEVKPERPEPLPKTEVKHERPELLPEEAYRSPQNLRTAVENRLGRSLNENEAGFLENLLRGTVSRYPDVGDDLLSFIKDSTILYDKLPSGQKKQFLNLMSDYNIRIPEVRKVYRPKKPESESEIIKTLAAVKSSEEGRGLSYVNVDKDYIVASDGHVLVAVKNTRNIESGMYEITHLGTVQKATDAPKYPEYRSVFPSKENLKEPRVLTGEEFLRFTEVVSQLKKANKIPKDVTLFVEIDGQVFNVELLQKLLRTISAFSPEKVIIRVHKEFGPSLIESKEVLGLIMPVRVEAGVSTKDVVSLNEILRKPEKAEVETVTQPVHLPPDITFKEYVENIKGRKLSELSDAERKELIKEFNEAKMGAEEYRKEMEAAERRLRKERKEAEEYEEIKKIEKEVKKRAKQRGQRGSISFEPVRKLDEQLKEAGIITETEPEVYRFMRHVRPRVTEYDFWNAPHRELPRFLKDWWKFMRSWWTSIETIKEVFPDKKRPAEIMIERENYRKTILTDTFDEYFSLRMKLSEESRRKVDEVMEKGRIEGKRGMYDDDTLRAMGLNDQEIELYRAWWRRHKKDVEIMREVLTEQFTIPDPDYSVPKSTVEAKALIQKMKDDGADPVSLSMARQILKIHQMCDEFSELHYIPFDRQGRYFLSVRKKGSTDPDYFSMSDSLKELKELALELRKKFPDAEIRIGENYKAILMGHDTLPPQMMARIKLILDDLKKEGVLPESLVDLDLEISNIMSKWGVKFPVHFLKAKNIAGWSKDYDKSIANYFASFASWASNVKYRRSLMEAIRELDPVKDAPLIEYYSRLNKYATMNPRFYSGISRVMFAYYLSGNPRAVLLNSLQSITMTLPYSTKYVNEAKALKIYKESVIDAMNYLTKRTDRINPELLEVIRTAYERGEISAQAVEAYLYPEKGIRNRALDVLSFGFRKAEEFNRVHATATAWRIAKEMKIPEKEMYEFIRKFISDTQFEYGRIYRPPAANVPIVAPLFVFRIYAYNWLRVMKNLLKEGDYRTFINMFIPIAVLGGISGIPFAKEFLDALEAVTGYDVLTEMRKKELKESESSIVSDMIQYGVPSVFERTISAAINPLELPRVEKTGVVEAAARAVGGVVFDLPVRAQRAYTMYQKYGDIYRAVENIMPEFIRNVFVAYRWYAENGALTASGEKVFAPKLRDIIFRGLGIQPLEYVKGIERIDKIRELEEEARTEAQKVNFAIAKSLYRYLIKQDNKSYEELLNVIENVVAMNVKHLEKGETGRIVIPDERAIKMYVLKMAVPEAYEIMKAPRKLRPEVMELYRTWKAVLYPEEEE